MPISNPDFLAGPLHGLEIPVLCLFLNGLLKNLPSINSALLFLMSRDAVDENTKTSPGRNFVQHFLLNIAYFLQSEGGREICISSSLIKSFLCLGIGRNLKSVGT